MLVDDSNHDDDNSVDDKVNGDNTDNNEINKDTNTDANTNANTITTSSTAANDKTRIHKIAEASGVRKPSPETPKFAGAPYHVVDNWLVVASTTPTQQHSQH